ncbi:MAG: undecaprenyl-diphosphate phosphatase [Candidatus Aenigmarchaeota archaeon]|nr:undecaprenyl-diphosphate phosphatase [Candidatus Aenigmarchaeota archaeon]
MDFIEAVVLAIIQGITEWLPISSEGVSSLVMINFFDKSLVEAVFMAGWLHTGTLLAAIVYFWKDIKEIMRNLPKYFRNPADREGYSGLTSFLLISTAFTAIIGAPLLFFSLDNIDFAGGNAMAFIGVLLVVTGLIQKFIRPSSIFAGTTRLKDAALVGIIQAFSVLPGLSRSGLTTSTLLLRKHDPEYALKLSFLMSIPAVLVAEIGLLLLQKVTFDVFSLVAILVSFLLGLLTLGSLLRIAQRVNFGYFCIFLGALSMLAVLL